MAEPDLTHFRKLLIYGGTFDPPHRAHVQLPQQAMRLLGAERVLYIPAAQSPHKMDSKPTPPHHRLAMLRLALHDFPEAIILTDELDRAEANPDQPSYTADTLENLRGRVHPDAQLRLLIGADQARVFDKWHRADDIAAIAEPVVMNRAPQTAEQLLAELPEDARNGWRSRVIELPPLDISSTRVRAQAVAGDATADIDDLLSPAVAAYIREHGLYQSADQ